MLDKLRPISKPLLEKIAVPIVKIHPNWITLIGFIFGVAFFCTMRKGLYPLSLLMLLGVMVDSLDGTVARLSGKESKFGAFFDSTLDRFTDVLLISAFAVSGLISWPLAMATAVMGLMISYSRATAEKLMENKIKLAVGLMERPERLIMIVLATLLTIFTPNAKILGIQLVAIIFWILLILSIITVGQRMWKARQILC
jgi:archaetidylinositol phosphate synthase